MTYTEIHAAFPHACAHPLRLCRICRWVLDHRGVEITNDIAPVAQTRAPTTVSGRHVGTPAVEGANENVPCSRPAPLAETQPGAPPLRGHDYGRLL